MASRSRLEDLELTREEAEGLAKAFQDKAFRDLFAEYAAELADPAQRAVYESEVAALERQRGVEARFLHPRPGWVLRTSQAGARRCYVNICSNPLVGRPEARPEPGGSRWSLPHCLAPGREELGRRGRRRLVYDVLFHPDALRLAARCARFRRLLDDTALEALERRFSPGLDRANAVPLRGVVKYKGVPQATLLRTALPGGAPRRPGDGEEEEGEGPSPLPPCPTPYAYPPPEPERQECPPGPPTSPPAPPAAATPRWTLRHRCYVDLQDYRESRDAAPSPVPRELVVTVELPLLSSAAQAQLEIGAGGRELRLDSRRPAYSLRLPLPYPVDEAGGRAAFNKSKRQLVVTLPVVAPAPIGQAPPPEEEEEEETPLSPGPPAESDNRPRKADAEGPAAALPPSATHVGTPSSSTSVECAAEMAPVSLAAPAAEVPSLDSPAPPPSGSPDVGTAPAAAAGAEEGAPGAEEGGSLQGAHLGSGSSSWPVALPLEGIGSAAFFGPPTTESAAAAAAPEDPGATVELEGGGDPVDPGLEGPREMNPLGPPSSTSREIPAAAPSLPSTPAGLPEPPGQEAPPRSSSSPQPPHACPPPPPFLCMQDDRSLTLLLQVPHVLPESLQGKVAPNGYTLTFTGQEATAYSLSLKFPPEHQLAAGATEAEQVNISPSNVAITLAKSPESAGLWTKLFFGSEDGPWQERLFITEDNVDGFLDRIQSIALSSQPEEDHRPLIDVLDISEDRSLIRLKAQENNSAEVGETEGSVSPPGEAQAHGNSRELSPGAQSCSVQTEAPSGSLVAKETRDRVASRPVHSLPPEPCNQDGASGPRKKLCDSEGTCRTGRTVPTTEAQPPSVERIPNGQGQDGPLASTHGKEGWEAPPAPPVLKETDMRDGTVQFISQHATHCAVTFQNTLLYELD